MIRDAVACASPPPSAAAGKLLSINGWYGEGWDRGGSNLPVAARYVAVSTLQGLAQLALQVQDLLDGPHAVSCDLVLARPATCSSLGCRRIALASHASRKRQRSRNAHVSLDLGHSEECERFPSASSAIFQLQHFFMPVTSTNEPNRHFLKANCAKPRAW